MSDRFDQKAQRLVPEHIDLGGGFARLLAGALRSTDAEAERRGELKGLEMAIIGFQEADGQAGLRRLYKTIRARIAELKKGGHT